MILEYKHINPYLPYYPKAIVGSEIYDLSHDNCDILLDNPKRCKIILRPLSDLFNGNYEHILDEFSELSLEHFENAFLTDLRPINAFDFITYTIALLLFENHFDIYNLIPSGYAEDINTLTKQ